MSDIKLPLVYVCLGDEDRAIQHYAEAEALYRAGFPGAQIGDGTTIDIRGNVAYINSPFLAEYIMLAPRSVPEEGNPDLYEIDLYGYTHRGDAMVPQGAMRFHSDYTEYDMPTLVGPEVYHFGDGIALLLVSHVPSPMSSMRSPMNFALSFAMIGMVEDWQDEWEGNGTPQGFLSTRSGVFGELSHFSQGDNLYTATTYGVDRTTEIYPTYRAYLNLLYPSNAVEEQTYNGGSSSVWFKVLDVLFVLVTASKNSAVEPAAYSLGTDVVDYTAAGTAISAPFPIAVPVGNNQVVTIGRKRNVDASLIFGGTFSIFAMRTFGAPSLFQSAVAVTGITTGHFDSNAWTLGPTTQSSYTVPGDFLRSMYLFESFAKTQRDCVPISGTETLLFGFREMLDSSPDWRASWVCFSVTTAAVTVKGVLSTHRGVFSGSSYERKVMDYMGATHDGMFGVYAYFRVNIAAISSGSFVTQGIYRYYSGDNGSTWDAGTLITLDYGGATPYAYWLSPPKWIGTDAVSGEVKIIMGYTVGELVLGGTKLTKTTMQTSVDGGITFTMSPVGDPNLAYVLPTGAWFYHTPRGQTSVQEFGNHEDGYAPSPYRHLPTYYGTPTKASRDPTADPNL